MYAQTMSFSKMLQILKARWRTLLSVWATVVGIVVLFCLFWPPKFTASASVVVDVQSNDPVGNTILAGGLLSSYMATQVDMLRSERVLLGAIRATHLGDDPLYKEKWTRQTDGRGSYESWLSDAVLETFVVKPTRGANSLTIEYKDRDPVRARDMANAIVKSYMDVTLQLRTGPAREFNNFFDARSTKLREDLETAQKQLSEFQREKGLLTTDERFDVETTRMNQLTTELVVLQSAASETAGRQAQAVGNSDRMIEVLTNPTVAQATTDVNRARAELEEMQTRLGDSHPKVIAARASLAELNRRLESAARQVSRSTEVTNAVAQSKLQGTIAELEAQRAKVLKLKEYRDQASVLQHDVENAQHAYELNLDKMTQSSAESQSRPTNVSVIKEASEPGVPSFPKPLLMTAVAFVVGTLLGIGAAMTREYFDQRVRGEEDVLQALNQPLLARIPRHTLRGKPASRRLAFQNRVLSGLSRPAIR